MFGLRTDCKSVLQEGVKPREDSRVCETIDDPCYLLTWLGPDRAVIGIRNAEDFQSKRTAVKKVIKQWVKYRMATKA